MSGDREMLGPAPPADAIERARIIARAASRLFDEAEVPTTIDRFELRERLGQGALGVVHAAWDPGLEREVAIKLLHVDAGAEQAALVVEARAMARLAHPNVVTVHEVGVTDDRVWLVMERVRGCTLRAWSKDPRAWSEVLDVFVQAAHGLAAAHAAGLVHRDFKPDNVLIRDTASIDPLARRVLVTDFGLAAPSEDSTRRDDPVGTPVYMAPEQHAGEPVDAAADQFAFGVALYEALWRRRPFAGNDLAELQRDKAEGRVIAPPRGSDAPEWLRAIVMRTLAPDPSERFGSMSALAVALGTNPARQRLRRLGLVALVVVALVAAVGATLQGIMFWDYVTASRR